MSDSYHSALSSETRNLTQLANDGKITLPAFRDIEVKNILESLERQRSVLVVGPQGVGKTCVLHGVAKRLGHNKKHLFEMATIVVLTGTRYLGEWQSKIKTILTGVEKVDGVLLFSDIWNLPTVGSSSNDPSALLDYLMPQLQSGQMQVIGEVTPERLQDIKRNPEFASLFDLVVIDSLNTKQLETVVTTFAEKIKLDVSQESIQRTLTLCNRFLAHSDGPGPALLIMRHIADYHQQKYAINEAEDISPFFVEKVFSIYSGLPLFVLSRQATKPVNEIRQWFRERVIGQEEAIESIVEAITLFKAGLHDPKKPVGSFLFVGPTGVGKTELAKAVSVFLFGSETRLLRFDLSEFKDYHAFQMLVGDPEKPQNPARLLDPVRAHPFQVILLDEIEKAHLNIWDVLLQLLDEGHVSPPRGHRVSFRNTIVIATSNVGSAAVQKNPMGFTNEQARSIPIKELEKVFRPELLNRFQHIVNFQSLSQDQVALIAKKEIKDVLTREGIVSRNLAVEVGEDVLEKVTERGYDREYGARALKRQIQQRVILPIANYLMEQSVIPGSILKLDSPQGGSRIRRLDTSSSRAAKRDQDAMQLAESRRFRPQDIRNDLTTVNEQLKQLGIDVHEINLRKKLNLLDAERASPEFWRDLKKANQIILETDNIIMALRRLDRLKDKAEDIATELEQSPGLESLQYISAKLQQLQTRLHIAKREMVYLSSPADNGDALLEIAPIAGTMELRDCLYEVYSSWAKWFGLKKELLLDPMDSNEPVFFAIKGFYSYGYLNKENGVHRSRKGDEHSAVRVTVTPWSGDELEVNFVNQRALKKKGMFGDKVRSRVEVMGAQGFVLQNKLSLSENRDLSIKIAQSWKNKKESDEVVRRYDFNPFLLKDYLTEMTSGKQALLKPQGFHDLLCQRVDILGLGK